MQLPDEPMQAVARSSPQAPATMQRAPQTRSSTILAAVSQKLPTGKPTQQALTVKRTQQQLTGKPTQQAPTVKAARQTGSKLLNQRQKPQRVGGQAKRPPLVVVVEDKSGGQ